MVPAAERKSPEASQEMLFSNVGTAESRRKNRNELH